MTLEQQNWPFRTRVLFLTSIITLVACILLGWPLTRTSTQALETQATLLRDTLTQQASTQAADAIFSQDLVSLNVMLSTLVEHPMVAFAAVYSLDNQVIAEQGSAPAHAEENPVRLLYQDQMIGSFLLVLDPKPLTSAIQRIHAIWFILTLLATALAALVGRYLGQRHGQYLDTLTAHLRDLPEQASDIRIHPQGELQGLCEQVQHMAQQQKAQRDMQAALARFTRSGNSMNLLSMGADNRVMHEDYTRASVLFIDFVSFDEAAARLAPSDMAQLLNQYYYLIHQAARLYNGTVDKYVGDGIMVLFGVPQPDEKDCFHGVCTALLLIGLIYEFNSKRRQQNLPALEFKMGMHTGTVLTGLFGDDDEQQYSVVGDTLHQAARLCRKGKAQRLLVSDEVIRSGRLTSTLMLEKAFSLKGSQPGQTIDCQWVNDLAPNYRALIQRQVQHISAQSVDEGSAS